MTKNVSPEPYDIPIRPTGPGKIAATRASMQYFTWFLSQTLREPVVDQTGLEGFYDFKLEIPQPPPPAGGERERKALGPDPGDLFAAIRDQLGLKVERRKAPVTVMVIDHAERPGEN